jgi:hypothetical protein|tara:strand:- start:181 stop:312 length:132 start_codon:yes stop_codon:yes gene_type:complete
VDGAIGRRVDARAEVAREARARGVLGLFASLEWRRGDREERAN